MKTSRLAGRIVAGTAGLFGTLALNASQSVPPSLSDGAYTL